MFLKNISAIRIFLNNVYFYQIKKLITTVFTECVYALSTSAHTNDFDEPILKMIIIFIFRHDLDITESTSRIFRQDINNH